MAPLSTVILLLSTAMGAVLQSTTGFGFAITMMAVLPHFMDSYLEATALSGMGALAISGAVAVRNIKKADFRIMLPVIIGYLASSTAVIPVAKGFSSAALTRALGIALIAVSIYFIFFNNKIKIRPTFFNGVFTGAIAGVGVGLFAIGGPPVVIYMLSVTGDKEVYRATSLAYFTLSSIYATGVRVANGIVTGRVLAIFMPMLLAIALGYYIGNKIFHKIDAERLKKVIYGFMAVSGATMLF